jgi:NAD(P)-dependent dehydrogenase (short-subunit alcohol dehydrogenase family)
MDEHASGPPVVAITGAARGIGYATARRFAQGGFRLALCDRLAISDAALDELRTAGSPACSSVSVDVGDRDEVARFIDESNELYGRIDVLVTCAGIHSVEPSESASWENWQAVLDVNLTGTFACIRAALPGMLARGQGRIVTLSSEQGICGYPQYAAYTASKGAVITLTRSLAREFAGRGILVNSVAPGPVVTDMLTNTDEFKSGDISHVPLGRWGEPDEIAATIYWIAGEGGTFLTGQIISPNGGVVI